jgi:thioredoxin reductase
VLDKELPYHDVCIVGGGPAGLSAALLLGRCCRSVLVCDTRSPRSWASHAMYAFITRDGVEPRAFREQAWSELEKYSNVQSWDGEVTDITPVDLNFVITLSDSRKACCRKVLIATGLFDQLPPIPHIEKYFGTSVFQCPYCDGWEMRAAAIAVYGNGTRGVHMSRAMISWSTDIVLCTDGPAQISKREKAKLAANRIVIIEKRVAGIEGVNGKMSAIILRMARRLSAELCSLT